MNEPHSEGESPRRTIRIFGRRIQMPASRPLRIGIGALLIIFGIFGFLPVLGFWMIPLGLFVISHEFPSVRRRRRRLVVWWRRMWQRRDR